MKLGFSSRATMDIEFSQRFFILCCSGTVTYPPCPSISVVNTETRITTQPQLETTILGHGL